MASTGHTETQAPHSTHFSSSTSALPSTIEIASTGHVLTQLSQPTHVSLSTFAAIIIPSYVKKKYFSISVTSIFWIIQYASFCCKPGISPGLSEARDNAGIYLDYKITIIKGQFFSGRFN